MENLLYPSWQIPYQEALLESDPQKLERKVIVAESEILLRLQELARVNGQATAERAALNDAIRALRRLQIDKLHYPTVPGEALPNQ